MRHALGKCGGSGPKGTLVKFKRLLLLEQCCKAKSVPPTLALPRDASVCLSPASFRLIQSRWGYLHLIFTFTFAIAFFPHAGVIDS